MYILNIFNIFKRFFNSKKPNRLEPTSFQQQVIAGIMLSVGHIRNPNSNRRSTGNYRLECTFKTGVLDFCKWIKFVLLDGLTTQSPPTPYPKNNPTQYWFSTSNSQYFTNLHTQWYQIVNNKVLKNLPNAEYFDKYFTEVSLAHSIMGDGYWDNTEGTVYICTENYKYEEVKFLINFFEKKFGLKAGLKKRNNGYRIRFSSKPENISKLIKLVKTHMHPLMLYKLDLYNEQAGPNEKS